MKPTYRENKYVGNYPGALVPAFICSEFSNGHLMLYSHGAFDIWCVYEAIPKDAVMEEFKKAYPNKLYQVKVRAKYKGNSFDGFFTNAPDCVYSFVPPKDVDYFGVLRDLASLCGSDVVWESFNTLYESIPQVLGVNLTRTMQKTSYDLADEYREIPDLRATFDCLLYAMIAENNRDSDFEKGYYNPAHRGYTTKLGKKVKALGVYQTLYRPDMTLYDIANFSKHKKWRELDTCCKEVGILTPNID